METANWKTFATLLARLIMALMFLMAVTFKFISISATAQYIAAAGFPMSTLLAWTAAFFELALVICFLACPIFCAILNIGVDRIVYKPLRTAPKLAPLVSAIGVSFIFMNIGIEPNER